jgi:hypothetical protein
MDFGKKKGLNPVLFILQTNIYKIQHIKA